MVFIGGLDPSYVLDKMPVYELEIALKGLYLRDKEGWEQTRRIYYAIAQTNAKDQLYPERLMPFAWDDNKVSTEVCEEDAEYEAWVKAEMEKIAQEKSKKNGSGFSNTAMAR